MIPDRKTLQPNFAVNNFFFFHRFSVSQLMLKLMHRKYANATLKNPYSGSIKLTLARSRNTQTSLKRIREAVVKATLH